VEYGQSLEEHNARARHTRTTVTGSAFILFFLFVFFLDLGDWVGFLGVLIIEIEQGGGVEEIYRKKAKKIIKL